VQKLRVKAPGGDNSWIIKELCAVLGEGKRVTIAKWVRAQRSLPTEVQAELHRYKKMPQTYIWDNPWLMGEGARAKLKLTPRYGMLALQLWQEFSSEGSWTCASFQNNICAPLKNIETWELGTLKRFGKVAADHPGFARVVQSLQTKGGLQKVRACMADSTPLQGTSDAQPGVLECHVIVKELSKLLAGGKEDNSVSEAAGSAVANGALDSTTSASTGEEEYIGFSAIDDIDEDPLDKKARELAHQEMDHVQLFRDFKSLQEGLQHKLLKSQRLCCIIDAQTSRIKVTAGYLDAAKEIGLEKLSIGIVCGPRLDLLQAAHAKASSLWPKASIYIVQLTAGDAQSDRWKPGFVITVHTSKMPSYVIPSSAALLKCRACNSEQPRLRCTERDCAHRKPDEKALLQSAPTSLDEEVNADDLETHLYDMMAPAEGDGDDDDGEEVGLSPAQKRDYIVDLWPFTRPVEFYVRFMTDVLHTSGACNVCIFTTSAHPAAWLAARKLQIACAVLLDRPHEHSIEHGKAIAHQYLFKAKRKHLANTDTTPRKRKIRDADIQCIQGPQLRSDQQIVEWLEQAPDPKDKFAGVDAYPTNLR